MGRRSKELLAFGAFLALVAILLAASFQFLDNHRWYWNNANIPSAIGVLSAASGGLLVGRDLPRTQKRRLWLIVLGGILGLVWIASGVAAVSFAFLGMNYFPSGDGYVGWDSYQGDYLVDWYHIRFLQLATLTGLLGGFSIGFGLAPKRKAGNHSQE